MDDLTLRYFDAEMRYLREAAKAFAQAHPDRAAMLDLDKAGTPDPYVERLFEGFAFSVGQNICFLCYLSLDITPLDYIIQIISYRF